MRGSISRQVGWRLLLLPLLLAAWGCGSMTSADDPPTHIGGWVLDGDYQPDRVGIEGVTVTELSQGATTSSTETGRFSLGQPGGEFYLGRSYVLRFEHVDYTTVEKTVRLTKCPDEPLTETCITWNDVDVYLWPNSQ